MLLLLWSSFRRIFVGFGVHGSIAYGLCYTVTPFGALCLPELERGSLEALKTFMRFDSQLKEAYIEYGLLISTRRMKVFFLKHIVFLPSGDHACLL